MTEAVLYKSVTDLAAARGVSKVAISKRVKSLEERGVVLSKAGPNGTKLIDVAAFDTAIGETTDFSRVRAKTSSGSAPASASNTATGAYTAAQAERMAYDARLKGLELARQQGLLVPVAQVAKAAALTAEKLLRAVDSMPTRADEIAVAVANGGIPAARKVLKDMVRDVRMRMAAELAGLAEAGVAEEAGGGYDVELNLIDDARLDEGRAGEGVDG